MCFLWLFWRATLVPVCSHVLHNGHPLPFVAPPWLLRCVGPAQSTPLSFFPMLLGGFCPMCVVSLVCPLFAATAWRLLPAVWCVVSSSLPAKPSAACVLLVGWCVRVCVEVMGPLVEGPALLLHYYPTQACVPCFYVVHMLTQCFGAKVVCLYACLTS